jgi:hypothetical protein
MNKKKLKSHTKKVNLNTQRGILFKKSFNRIVLQRLKT